MDIESIIKTVGMVGSSLPAFKALLDQVLDTLPADDQEKLKQTYSEAMADAELAHRDAQAL